MKSYIVFIMLVAISLFCITKVTGKQTTLENISMIQLHGDTFFQSIGPVGKSYLSKQPVAVGYLDPSTGSMVISAIVGVIATIVLGMKTFWYKIVSFFKRKKK